MQDSRISIGNPEDQTNSSEEEDYLYLGRRDNDLWVYIDVEDQLITRRVTRIETEDYDSQGGTPVRFGFSLEKSNSDKNLSQMSSPLGTEPSQSRESLEEIMINYIQQNPPNIDPVTLRSSVEPEGRSLSELVIEDRNERF